METYLNCRDIKLNIGKRILMMGVLNVTPDSFYDGGRYESIDNALLHAEKMISEGADIIDIGGESTKPGSRPVNVEEELKRVIPIIKKLTSKFKIPISIDTQKSEVARKALEAGASILNDISALRTDPEMVQVAKEFDVPVILMHMKGTPLDMQANPVYSDVIKEIKEFFIERIEWAKVHGIKEENIIIDPGICFGKLVQHNLVILKNLIEFKELKRPILIGPSRKSFIGRILNKNPEERLWGTAAAVSVAAINGADIIRVHDVSEMLEVTRIVKEVLTAV